MITYNHKSAIPNSIREFLLQSGRGELALLLDALILARLKLGGRYTFKEIREALDTAGIACSTNLVRRNLKHFIFITQHIIHGRGRPTIVYKLPSIAQVMQHFGCETWLSSDAVTAGDLTTLHTYKLALHRELVKRRPGEMSRAWEGRRLGVSGRAVARYDKILGTQITPNYDERQLWESNWQDILKTAKKGASWLVLNFWETGEKRKVPAKTGIVYKYLGKATVTLVTQRANSYRLDAPALQY